MAGEDRLSFPDDSGFTIPAEAGVTFPAGAGVTDLSSWTVNAEIRSDGPDFGEGLSSIQLAVEVGCLVRILKRNTILIKA